MRDLNRIYFVVDQLQTLCIAAEAVAILLLLLMLMSVVELSYLGWLSDV